MGTDVFHVEKRGGKIAYPGKAPCGQVAYEARLRHVWKALEFEMLNMTFEVGDTMRRQKDGLGIGAFTSPLGACMMCMDFECVWMHCVARFLYGPLRGARHVDDLILVIHRYDYGVIKHMVAHCYPPSMVLKLDHPPGQVIDCLGCEVMLLPTKGVGVVCKNKNESPR